MGKQWEGLSRNFENRLNEIKLTKKQKKQQKSKRKSQTVKDNVSSIEKQMFVTEARISQSGQLLYSIPTTDDTNTDETGTRNFISRSSDFKSKPAASFSTNKSDALVDCSVDVECGFYVPLTIYVDIETDLKAIAMDFIPFLSDDKDHVQLKSKANNTESAHGHTCRTKWSDRCENVTDKNVTPAIEVVAKDFKTPKEFGACDKNACKTDKKFFGFVDVKHTKQDTFEAGIMLTGLHTCGDLASNMLELFVTNPDIKLCCSVGCCYHLLTEAFVNEELKTGNIVSIDRTCTPQPLYNTIVGLYSINHVC